MHGLRDPLSLINYLLKLVREFKFMVHTKQKQLFSVFESLLGKSLIIKDYVSRSELLLEFSKADFLVNVDTVSKDDEGLNAVPSKLIDYLYGRPILSYQHDKLDKVSVSQFLDGDYSCSFVITNSQDSRIERACENFLYLIK